MINDPEKFKKYMSEQAEESPGDRGRLNLEHLVIQADDALIDEGYQPFQRHVHACAKIADRVGLRFTIGRQDDDLLIAVGKIYEKLYRASDLHMPPMHIGTLMFRDTFLPLRIPVIFGQPKVDFIKCLQDVPENILRWILQTDETAFTFYDQTIDLFDFVYGLDELSKLKKHPEQAIEFWLLAKQQLEGAAATLLGSIDKYTVIQNSIIAIELLLKGALAARSLPKAEIIKFRHNMKGLADRACSLMPSADHERLKMVVGRTPQLVERRYQMKEYKRTELGQILMGAQYVAGEILRQFTDRNLRASLVRQDGAPRSCSLRYYPVLVR
jgi:hypothetical protein